MRPFETLLLVANVLAFVSLTAMFPQVVRWMRHAAPFAFLTVLLQAAAEGFRWQMAPAYALAGLFTLVWMLKRLASGRNPVKHGWMHRLGNGTASGLAILGLALAIALPNVLPVFKFPKPTGPFAIGTLTYHWVDADRLELFSEHPGARRELMVQVWYPANADSQSPRAPYVEKADALGKAYAQILHLPAFAFSYWSYVETNAISSAPIESNEQPYPVLILLEGLIAVRQMNTFQVEELVSHGYVVAAVDQPYSAASVVFPDGRQTIGWSKPQLDGLIQQSIIPAETAPVLLGRSLEKGIAPYLAQDAVFALNRLAALNLHDPNGILTGHLDLEHAGIFGVSLGGIVVGEVCRIEPRLRACLIMDAPMPLDVARGGLQQPSMWITRDAQTMRLEGWSKADIDQHQNTMREAFAAGRGAGYFVAVKDMFHLNLTDLPYWTPLSSLLGLTGPIDGRRAHGIINTYTTAFFDRHLRGRTSALLDGPAEQYGDVVLEHRQARRESR